VAALAVLVGWRGLVDETDGVDSSDIYVRTDQACEAELFSYCLLANPLAFFFSYIWKKVQREGIHDIAPFSQSMEENECLQ